LFDDQLSVQVTPLAFATQAFPLPPRPFSAPPRQKACPHGYTEYKQGIKELVSSDLRKLIREVPDFPKPGILFYDITTLLKDKDGFHGVIDGLKARYRETQVDVVLGIEARGFIFAPALAYALNAGFVPVRKPHKLPAECVSVTYDLEYGTDSLEMHKDAIANGNRVLIVDDLLATGGTAQAAARMVREQGGVVAGLGFVVELTFLHGRQKLAGYDVFSLLPYDQ
jgi:adenine phosphoribosyltransferase